MIDKAVFVIFLNADGTVKAQQKIGTSESPSIPPSPFLPRSIFFPLHLLLFPSLPFFDFTPFSLFWSYLHTPFLLSKREFCGWG